MSQKNSLKTSVLILLLIVSLKSFTQNIDSLNSVRNNSSLLDTIRLDAIDRIIDYYLNENLDSALIYTNIQLNFAKQINNMDWAIKALSNLTLISYNQGDFSSSLSYSNTGVNLSFEINDSAKVATFYRFQGMAYEMLRMIDSAKTSYHQGLSICLKLKDSVLISRAYNSLGVFYYSIAEYDSSLIHLKRSLDLKRKLNSDKISISNTISNIGTICFEKGDLTNALINYLESIKIQERENYSEGLVGNYQNIGNVFNQLGNIEKAIIYYEKSLDISKTVKFELDEAMVKLNLGELYIDIGNIDLARKVLTSGLELSMKLNQNHLIAFAYLYLGQLEFEINNLDKSFDYFKIAYDKAKSESLLDVLASAANSLAEILIINGELKSSKTYLDEVEKLLPLLQIPRESAQFFRVKSNYFSKTGELKKELEAFKEYIVFRDSVYNEKAIRETTKNEVEYFFEMKQLSDSLEFVRKTELQNIRIEKGSLVRRYLTILASLLILIVIGVIISNRKISEEKTKSDNLLLNILPSETAKELKQKGEVDAQRFDEVTVLFADFKEFTKLSKDIEPVQLVKSIDFYFKGFDQITTKYKLEKIKTIGDAYMCAGGLPTVNQTHAKDVICSAKEMIELVKKEYNTKDDLVHFEIRIGVHTGPVVAGIVGIKKWQYDIWGDTVNIAARMESNSLPGMINVSEATYEKIKGEFPCKYRGEIEIKNRGFINMYFVS